jgi:hypothetical protein
MAATFAKDPALSRRASKSEENTNLAAANVRVKTAKVNGTISYYISVVDRPSVNCAQVRKDVRAWDDDVCCRLTKLILRI